MFIPIISPLSQRLYPRKGGGGGGGHGSGGGHSGSSGGHSGSSGESGGNGGSSGSKGSNIGKSTQKSVPISGSTAGRTSATAYGSGTTRIFTIPAGQPFAGRTSGGAIRGQVYGTSRYGSGYPGFVAGSVLGRPFPFVFWPVVWGPGYGYGPYYLHDPEYGLPSNTSRPGGPLAEAIFTSNSTGSNSTFFVISDNSTVTSLIASIAQNCTLGASSSRVPAPYNATQDQPLPEQAVAFYRASSIVLTLDGYNDTAVLGNDTNVTATALPSWVDTTLLNCLNQTIGQSAPLFSSAHHLTPNVLAIFMVLFVMFNSFRL
ncbi:hypothetical protein SCP_0509430 [Sparassis crispa]|uniref:Uncharacterized protein n=1 Tax=Sparassis crispa TaxID=139825 RepID=A0A401GNU9_9APHY|nr:hypothetical protein SCP_0509430 [Sparassis crispa]GBE83886.1 hypothetical protein SCP_0509430 [Sparassis crispa]